MCVCVCVCVFRHIGHTENCEKMFTVYQSVVMLSFKVVEGWTKNSQLVRQTDRETNRQTGPDRVSRLDGVVSIDTSSYTQT